MKSGNIVLDKSFEFAIAIVNSTKNIQLHNKEYMLTKQLLKSGRSVGANIREAHNAESKKDFIHKMAIAQKECDETKYKLELLYETEYIIEEDFKNLFSLAAELLKILGSIILTTKRNHNLS